MILNRYTLYSAINCALVTGCCIASQKLFATVVGSREAESGEFGQSNIDLRRLTTTASIADRIFHTSRNSHITHVMILDTKPYARDCLLTSAGVSGAEGPVTGAEEAKKAEPSKTST